MIRVQSNVVLKYFEPLDEFVRIRLFTTEEVQRLLQEAAISDKRGYVALVLNASLLDCNGVIAGRFGSLNPRERAGLEDRLFSLCVESNPAFDLRRVTLPVPRSESSEIHLLEQHVSEPKKDFRRLQGMEKDLSDRVVGQEEAVHTVSRAIRKAMTGLRDPERPVASFLFVGQTGVGKTELVKALTRYLYEDLSLLLRIDCSEYALPHEYAKLIGAPPGYVGHDEGGLLAEAARRRTPVVLFDEVEKSDVKVHHLLLQLMDEGVVTDNKARRIEFRDAIFILTSNLGAEELSSLRDRIGFDADRRVPDRDLLSRETLGAVRSFFRPEFVNRLTEVVLFRPLDLGHCERIAGRFLEEVTRHAAAVPLQLRFEPRVARHLAEKAYRPEYGAREVRRTVEREIEAPLSDLLIDGTIHEGDDVEVRIRRDRIAFHRN